MLGAMPLGSGNKVTGISREQSQKNDNLFPPFKCFAPETLPESDFALPLGYNPVPIYSIGENIDDLFNKGMKYLCPK